VTGVGCQMSGCFSATRPGTRYPVADTWHLTPALMKLLALSIGSWLLGLSAILLTFYAWEGESLNGTNVKSVTLMSLIIAALVFSLAYAPSLFWLQRRLGGCKPRAAFPLTAAIIINLPVILIGLLAIGRTLAVTEALASIGSFVLMGAAFGLGFVWHYQHRSV
jgi:hypothetical protein